MSRLDLSNSIHNFDIDIPKDPLCLPKDPLCLPKDPLCLSKDPLCLSKDPLCLSKLKIDEPHILLPVKNPQSELFDPNLLETCNEIIDPIYNTIQISFLANSIINTLIFQSLRDKKQLGACFMYIPTAVHNRFSHSLGVYNLAKKVMKLLKKKQPELHITDRDIEIVGIAGLVHDLGHGPYSHMFETYLKKNGTNFCHENMSIVLLKYIVEHDNINLTEQEIISIEHMIKGNIPPYDIAKTFMYCIVSNKETGIDVDKFDYIQRDCYFTGNKYMFNYKNLINNCRVINNKICYNEDQIDNIYELFRSRFLMFKHVYMNGVNKGIELMIMDIISNLGPIISIQDHINDPEKFYKLTDNYIISLVEYFSHVQGENNIALNILNNMKKGKIYTVIVEEKWEPKNEYKNLTCNDIMDDIIKFCNNTIINNDLRIEIFEINFGKGNKNPLKSVDFYDNNNINASKKLAKINNILIPTKVSEKTIRIYITDPFNTHKIRKIKKAYYNMCEKYVGKRYESLDK